MRGQDGDHLVRERLPVRRVVNSDGRAALQSQVFCVLRGLIHDGHPLLKRIGAWRGIYMFSNGLIRFSRYAGGGVDFSRFSAWWQATISTAFLPVLRLKKAKVKKNAKRSQNKTAFCKTIFISS